MTDPKQLLKAAGVVLQRRPAPELKIIEPQIVEAKLPTNKQIWAVDCESDPFLYGRVPRPFLWGIYEGYTKNYWEFERTDDCIDFLIENDVIAYAHNGGKFDWHFITHRMQPRESVLVINGRLAKFNIGLCEFRDSFNLMPISLDQYQKSSIEYWKMEECVRRYHMEEIRAYLKSDCINLWNMVYGFECEYGRHLTQAGAAMKIWTSISGHKPPRSGEFYFDTFKPFYFGGRVQCFESGEFDIEAKSIDIHSAYPDAMLADHPIGLDTVAHSGTPQKSIDKLGHCFFNIRCIARGAFPYRTLNKALYFPADDVRRDYHVTGWELVAALETNTVDDLEIIDWIEHLETVNFSEYVLHFWNKRVEAQKIGDKGRDYYCKIFLNGLYGKFASDPRNYKQYELWPKNTLEQAIEVGKDFDFFYDWLLVSEHIKSGKYRFYNLATGASITGKVRAKMWRGLCSATRPLYCDTDAITAVEFSGLKYGSDLGDWGLEAEYDKLVLAGKKMYANHIKGRGWEDSSDRRKSKALGNWKKATKGASLSADELLTIVRGGEIKFLPPVPTFSVHHQTPRFIPRVIRATANDITVVPRELDPMYVKSVTRDTV